MRRVDGGLNLALASVFETIVVGLLHTYALQFRVWKRAQPPENLDAKILGRRNLLAKLRNFVIERAMIEGFEYFALNEAIQIGRDSRSCQWLDQFRPETLTSRT